MKTLKFLIALVMLLLVVSCGGIQKARYFQPAVVDQSSLSKEWGDGVATADQNICLWVGDETALYLPMMGGPIGLPFFPLGVLAGKIDRPGYFDLSVWVVPKDEVQKSLYKFDPTGTYLEFENGDIKQPQTIQVSRFKTYWDGKNELISYPEHWGVKPLGEYGGPIELLDWSRFTMRFEKPDKNIGPVKVIIEGLIPENGQKIVYKFAFKEVTKYRYLISGHHPNGEWGLASEASPCREMFKCLEE